MTAAHTNSAARSPRAWVVLLSVLVAALATDLASKRLAFDHLAPIPIALDRQAVLDAVAGEGITSLIPRHAPTTVIPHGLELTLVLNRGAVFGLGQGQRWLFIIFTVLAVSGGLWAFCRMTERGQWFTHLSLGLVLGGGLGNLYDRVLFACVRDFLHPLPGLRLPFGLEWPGGSSEVWPYVSNLADLYLLVGIAGLLIHLWRTDASAAADRKKADADAKHAASEQDAG